MIARIEFPREIKQFQSYQQNEEFHQEIRKSCLKQLGDEDAMKFTLIEKNLDLWCWQCDKPMCTANFEYRIDKRNVFKLIHYNPIHEHKRAMKNISREKKLQIENENRKIIFFPSTFDNLLTCTDKQDIKKKIKDQWYNQYPDQKGEFKIFQRGYCVHVYCRKYQCKWRLLYRFNLERKIYQLLSQRKTEHNHIILELTTEAEKMFPEVYEVFEAINDDTMEENFKATLQKKMGINYRQFLNYVKVYQNKNEIDHNDPAFEIKRLVQSLKGKNYEVLFGKPGQNQQSNYEVILVTSRLMKFLLKSYGRVVYFEEVELYQNNKTSKYSVYLFIGFNHNFNPLIYGIGICRQKDTPKIQKLLQIFLTLESPELQTLVLDKSSTIVINGIKQIRQTHEKLKYINIHFFHTPIRDRKKHISYDEQNDFILANLSMLSLIARQSRTDAQNFEQYLNDCLESQLQNFTGLRSCQHKSITGQIKLQHFKTQYFFNDKHFKRVIKSILDDEQKLNSQWYNSYFHKIPAQDVIFLPQLKKIRYSMAKRPFTELIKQLNKVPYLNITYFDYESDLYLVDDGFYPYTVYCETNQYNKETWKCECFTKPKKGIPCSHLMKVLVCLQKSIVGEIEKFWLIDMGIMNLYKNQDISTKDIEMIKTKTKNELKSLK